MSSNKPILHISICFCGSSKSKTELKKQLSTYLKRLSNNPEEPFTDIHLNTFHAYQDKLIHLKTIYNTVVTHNAKHSLPTSKELYTFVVLLISLLRHRLYETNANSRAEDWMLISITPSDANDQTDNHYDIQWSFGQ